MKVDAGVYLAQALEGLWLVVFVDVNGASSWKRIDGDWIHNFDRKSFPETAQLIAITDALMKVVNEIS